MLATADVAVLHPGQNSLAEVASLRLPAIVVPAARPFDEQHVTAAALDDGWPAVVVDAVPTTGWRDLLDEAFLLDGEGWSEWCDGGAPTRIARVVAGVVDAERARMSTAVVTVVHGRHDHLARQRASLAASTAPPDHHVVVAVDDPVVAAADWCTASVAGHPLGLPIAAARNRGAREAIDRGADVLVFLDVDCLADPGLVEAYADVVRDEPGTVWSGPVTYLDPPPADGYDLPTSPPSTPRTRRGRRRRRRARQRSATPTSSGRCPSPARSTPGTAPAGSASPTSATAARTPTSPGWSSTRGWTWAGSARRGPSTSGTRCRDRRSSTSTTSSATPGSTGAAGATTPMLGWLEAFEERGLVRRDDAGRWLAVG